MDLILVSRTQSKLDAVAGELKAKYSKISVITFAIDLTNLTDKALNELGEEVNALDVGILVNNAGMSLDHPEYLEGTDLKTNKDLIAINAYAPTAVRGVYLCDDVFISHWCLCKGAVVAAVNAHGAAWDEEETQGGDCQSRISKWNSSCCATALYLCWNQGVHKSIFKVSG